MSDTYQAVLGLDVYVLQITQSVQDVASEYNRPSAVFRPYLGLDGDMWCALYGENLAVGVAGFVASPEAAMRAFDEEWVKTRGEQEKK
jgi:hypothetical protein